MTPRSRRTPAVGQLIARRRSDLGLSQREVSALTGGAVSYAALSRIENGFRYPTLHTLEHLSSALALTITINAHGTTVEW